MTEIDQIIDESIRDTRSEFMAGYTKDIPPLLMEADFQALVFSKIRAKLMEHNLSESFGVTNEWHLTRYNIPDTIVYCRGERNEDYEIDNSKGVPRSCWVFKIQALIEFKHIWDSEKVVERNIKDEIEKIGELKKTISGYYKKKGKTPPVIKSFYVVSFDFVKRKEPIQIETLPETKIYRVSLRKEVI